MAQWKPLNYINKKTFNTLGDGINVGANAFEIKETEATYLRNIGSGEYPAMSVRPGRSFYSTSMATVTNPNGIGERNNQQLHIVSGNTWKTWSTNSTGGFIELTTTLTSTEAEIMDFPSGASRYSILMNSTQKLIWDGTSTAIVLGDASTPFTKIFTVNKGRIYAARENDVLFSGFYKPNDWTTANDAGSFNVTKAKGAITAITSYNDNVIIFTEYGMHELHGSGPNNFDLIDIEGEIGCLSNKSIVKCNKNMYWYSQDGIYETNGATPTKISQNVDEYIKLIPYAYRSKVAGGSYQDLVYFAIPYGAVTANNLLLVYDTRLRKWYVETGNYIHFVKMSNGLYGLDSTGGVQKMYSTSLTDNGTAISWDFITKAYVNGVGQTAETLQELGLLYNASSDAILTVSYTTSDTDNNSTSFKVLATSSDFTKDSKSRNKRLIMPTSGIQNEPYYRLKLSGTGQTTIFRMEKLFRIKRR